MVTVTLNLSGDVHKNTHSVTAAESNDSISTIMSNCSVIAKYDMVTLPVHSSSSTWMYLSAMLLTTVDFKESCFFRRLKA